MSGWNVGLRFPKLSGEISWHLLPGGTQPDSGIDGYPLYYLLMRTSTLEGAVTVPATPHSPVCPRDYYLFRSFRDEVWFAGMVTLPVNVSWPQVSVVYDCLPVFDYGEDNEGFGGVAPFPHGHLTRFFCER